MLGLLAIAGSRGIAVDGLVDELWGERATVASVGTIRAYVSRLRRALQPARDTEAIEVVSGRYHLRPDVEVDAAWMERRLGEVRRSGELSPAVRAEQLADVLSAWRGAPYGECLETPMVRAEATRLEEVWLLGFEDRVQAELDCGHHRALVGELQALVDRYPWREGLLRYLMLALYRSGRQADALRAAHVHRTLLREELGVEASRTLEVMEHAILVRDPLLDWVPPAVAGTGYGAGYGGSGSPGIAGAGQPRVRDDRCGARSGHLDRGCGRRHRRGSGRPAPSSDTGGPAAAPGEAGPGGAGSGAATPGEAVSSEAVPGAVAAGAVAAGAAAPGEAATRALVRGREKLRRGDPGQASDCFSEGLMALRASAPSAPGSSPPEVVRVGRELACDLLLGLAESRRQSRDLYGARSAALASAESARQVGSARRLAQAAAAALQVNTVGRTDRATLALADEALDQLPRDDQALRAEVLAGRADYQAYAAGDGEAAIHTSRQAVELAHASGDATVLGRCLFAHAEALAWTPGVNERLLLGEHVIAHARSIGNAWLECDGLHTRALARLALGDVAGFDRDRGRIERLLSECQRWYWYPSTFLPLWRGMRAMMQGQLGAAEPALAEVSAQASHEPNVQNLTAGQLFFIRREQGRLEELYPVIAQQARHEPKIVAFSAALALTHLELGDHQAARDLLVELVPDDRVAVPRDLTLLATLCGLAEVAGLVGDQDRAAVLLQELLPYRGQLAVWVKGVACGGAVDRFAGMLLATMGDRPAARQAFASALELEARIDAPPLLARTELELGRWLVRQGGAGERQEGADRLDRVAATARALGLVGLERQVCQARRPGQPSR